MIGIPTRKTIVVPCSVNRRLNVSAGTSVRPGHASCRRMREASMPPITRKMRPVTTYMMPRRLWSTVTTQSCSVAAKPEELDASTTSSGVENGAGTGVVAMASAQRHEVRDQLVELGVVELHRRHEGPDLERGRVLHPGAKIFPRVAHGTRAERRAAHQMRQVRAEHAVSRRPADAVAVDAGQRREQIAASPRHRRFRRRGLLRRDPCPELLFGMNDRDKEHQRVLEPAILGALTDIRAHLPWLDPDSIRLVRDRIHLPRQLRNPEAVCHVDGLHGDERRGRVGRVTHGDVDLVRGDDPELRIADLPPPLVADDSDLERVRRLVAAFDPIDVPGGDQKQDDDDQERHDRPRQLDLRAAIHLRRLRSEEHTSELQSLAYLVCRLLLEKKKKNIYTSMVC